MAIRKVPAIILITVVLSAATVLTMLLLRRPQNHATTVPVCHGCNVVFVSFDTLRRDRVGLYGYALPTTPTIDSLSRTGYIFDDAVSASSWTLPSTMTWFTGLSPSHHRVTNKERILESGTTQDETLQNSDPGAITLADIFRANGYRTGAFTGGAALNRSFGFGQGFDTYIDDRDFGGFRDSVPKAMEWIRENRGGKLFVFLHGYDIHGQYDVPGGFDRRFVKPRYTGTLNGGSSEWVSIREGNLTQKNLPLTKEDARFLSSLYDEKVARADAEFAKFIEAYRSLGLLDRTVFILTSDHGEELYDHFKLDHGHTLYGELIHVPLVIVIPGVRQSIRIAAPVGSADLFPTVLSLVGIAPGEQLVRGLDGKDLVPLMSGQSPAVRDIPSETDYRYVVSLRSLIDPAGQKIIYDLKQKNQEWFNLQADRTEKHDLFDNRPSAFLDLQERMLRNVRGL